MGQFWMNIIEKERGDKPGNIKVLTIPTPCSHCQDAECMKVAKKWDRFIKERTGWFIIDPVKAKEQKAIAERMPIGALSGMKNYR